MLDISLRYTIWSGITTKKKNHITLVNFLFNFEDEGWELLVFFFFFEKQILFFIIIFFFLIKQILLVFYAIHNFQQWIPMHN